MKAHAVGIDIGGTSTEVVVVDAGFDVLTRGSALTEGEDWPRLRDRTHELAVEVMVEAGVVASEVVGVGLPGFVDSVHGTAEGAANLLAVSDRIPVGAELSAAFGVPVVVENDVRAGSVEALHLASMALPEVHDVVYLSIGTGVAAGIVIDGSPLQGGLGIAGDIGHAPVLGGHEPCPCGLTGCVETRISGPALARRWPAASGLTFAPALFDAAEQGDPSAIQVVDELVRDVRDLVHWLFHTTGTQAVVLGGGVCTAHEGFLQRLRVELVELRRRARVTRRWASPERVLAAPPGHPTGALGAARTAAARHDEHGRHPAAGDRSAAATTLRKGETDGFVRGKGRQAAGAGRGGEEDRREP